MNVFMKDMIQSFENRTIPKDVGADKYQPYMYEITNIIPKC